MQSNKYSYLFLYTRLPDYFLRCVQYLIESSSSGSEAIVVCYPRDVNAPYHYENLPENIRILEKQELDSLDSWQPDLIYVAGWGDKTYNRFTHRWRGKIPVVIGMDNPWKGTLKQRLATLIARSLVKNKASHLWVTGYPQYEFARRIGFPANRILHDLYCADTQKFIKHESLFRKRIVYVGRLVTYKRPDWLLESFSELLKTNKELDDWELLFIGSGPMLEKLQEKYKVYNQIVFQPFVQPKDIVQYYHQSSIFCLPSLNEHWGVVIQEAAAAGLALLLSDTCGAASTFLINGYNGFSFASNNHTDLKNKLWKLMTTDPQVLQEMGKRSIELSQRINYESWCGNLRSVFYGEI